MNESSSKKIARDRATVIGTRPSCRGNRVRKIKAMAALLGVVALAVAPPLLLVRFVGNPLPAGGVDLGAPLGDDAIIGLLAAVVWILWAQVMVCLVVETIAVIRASSVDVAIPGVLGVQQHLARTLVTAIAIAVASIPAGSRHTAPTTEPVAVTFTPHIADSNKSATEVDVTRTPEKSAATREVTVVRGDTLWSIADRHLGAGERWPEIAHLNDGRTMTTGQTFRSADLIRPGWSLLVPGEASTDATTTGANYTVKPGDTLSAIAAEHLGDEDAWHDIFEDSQHLSQPVPLTDPDMIQPGQKLHIPPGGKPVLRPTTPTVETPESRTPAGSLAPTPPPNTLAGNARDDVAPNSPATVEDSIGSAANPSAPPSASLAPQPAGAEGETRTGTDSPLPGWIMQGMFGGGTLLAGALLIALRKRRAHQHRYRRPGRTIAEISAPLMSVEQSVTVAGAATTGTVELIDTVLKLLALSFVAAGEPLPDLVAVEVTDTMVAAHFTDEVTSPGVPWEVSEDGLCLIIGRTITDHESRTGLDDSPPPWPMLVTIGHDNRDTIWLLNLEDQTVHLSGDRQASEDFARFLAAEIACNPWSHHTRLDLFGIAGEVATISPHRIHAHPRTCAEAVADAVSTIDRLDETDTTTSTARALHNDPDPWPSRLLVIGESDLPDDLETLLRLVDEHPGRTATSVLLTHDVEANTAVRALEIHIDERRRLTVSAADLNLAGVGLTAEEAHGCASLLAQADQTDDSPAPDASGDRGWQKMATATGSLRDQYRVGRQAACLEPTTSLLERPDDDYVQVASTTPEDLDAVAPRVAESVCRNVAGSDANLDTDLEQWSNDDCARPRLSLLGPVKAHTSGMAIGSRRPFYTELFAFIATRPHGATAEEVAAAFDLTPGRVRTDINALRGWLGIDPTTGKKFLPDARHAPSAQARGIGVYEIPDALIDADLFRRLRVRGESRGPDGVPDFVRALQLVAGRPFDQTRLSGWGWLAEGDRLDHHMVCAITDVAHVVVTQSLQTGDLGRAQSAIDIALMAAPDEEISHLDFAAVLEAQGHHTTARRLIQENVCNRRDDGDAATELPERTERIIRGRRWLDREAI